MNTAAAQSEHDVSATFYTVPDAAIAELTPSAAPPIILEGNPQATKKVLHQIGDVELGIWECTPGIFRSEKKNISEFMHIVTGKGRIEHADGTVTVLKPGAILHVHDGYVGTWYVEETVRKVYTAIVG